MLATFLALVWMAVALPPTLLAALSPGDHLIKLSHGGRTRSAIVHVPRRAGDSSALPVVLNLHGGGGHGANQREYSLMDVLAERKNFVAVYPNGSGRLESRLLTWNAGSCCGYAALNGVDDVGFVRVLVAELAAKLPVDRRRIFATGLSNGAMMAYRLAVEASDLVAAIAPVAGGMVLAEINSTRAVPILHMHSFDDPRALYSGGLGPPFPLTNSRVNHPNIDQVITRWAAHDGCKTEPHVADLRSDKTPRNHTATKYVHGQCRDGAEVVLWKLTGAGHVWPGGKPKYLERVLGPSTDIIDANREMWEFFTRFALK